MIDKKARLLNIILPIVALGVVVVFWAVAALIIGNEFILPTVSDTLGALCSLCLSGEFYLAFLFTFLRSIAAFIFSFISAFLLAVLSNKFNNAERVISPLISVIRALPTIAVVLLLLFWTNSIIAPIIVTILVVLPTTYSHLKSALDTIDKSVPEASRVDGANEKQVFLYVEFPLIKHAVYSSIGGGISLNFKLMVAAEVLAQTANSIGYMLNTSKVYFEIASMLAIVVVTVIVGIIIEAVFNNLSQKAASWLE